MTLFKKNLSPKVIDMKHLNLLTVCLFCICMVFTGCKDHTQAASADSGQTNYVAGQLDTLKEQNIDSILLKQIAKIDGLSSKIDDLAVKSEQFGKDLKDTEATSSKIKWAILACAILGLIALAVAILLYWMLKKVNQILKNHRFEINKLKAETKKPGVNVRTPAKTQPVKATLPDNDELARLTQRIQNLEREIGAIKNPVPTTNVSEKAPVSQGYLGAIVKAGQGYFRGILSSNGDEARFSANIVEDTLEFAPLTLQIATSYDYMDWAVEFTGVSRGEAKNMTITSQGLATRQGEKWVIIKKAVVKLTK